MLIKFLANAFLIQDYDTTFLIQDYDTTKLQKDQVEEMIPSGNNTSNVKEYIYKNKQ